MATQRKNKSESKSRSKTKPTGDPKSSLEKMKTEVASELGISNYDAKDKASMSSKQNGNVGGQMTKKLVEMGQKELSKKK